MSALRSRIERCAPRRSFLVVSSANQRSTRFSQELWVGVQIEPDDVADLPMNCGSRLSFHVSDRCGWSPNAFQIRCTAVWLRPSSAAIERVDQCVASFGLVSSVLTITSSTF
jgi:hypothetical protein